MAGLVKTDAEGCLISEAFAKEACEHFDDENIHQPRRTRDEINALVIHPAPPIVPAAANAAPVADNETDTAIRTGRVGTSSDYAREDHNHPIRRQGNPGDPVFTHVLSNGSSVTSELIVARRSTEEWYEYVYRVNHRHGSDNGWNRIIVPSIAGFQRPQITVEGTYRYSGQWQDDEREETRRKMEVEAGHYLNTLSVYIGPFQRDNQVRTWTTIRVKYIRN